MASAQTTRGGVTYYTVNLSTSVSNVNDTTARIYWTATVDFGDWYYYGVRLHVKVGGVWRASGDGYTTSSWKRAVTVSGYADAERKDNDYDVWVEAYTESVAVNGYGGVGATTSCGEGARIGKVPAYEPAAPTDLRVTRSTDGTTELEWVNHPDDDARKYYDGINVYRHTNGGDTENPYNSVTISNWRDTSTSANNYYDYDVRARWRGGTSERTSSVRVYKTPSPPASVSLSRSGDGEVSLVVRGPDIPFWISGFDVRATSDGGRTYKPRALTADRQEPGVWTMTDPSAVAGEKVVYEVRTYREEPVAGRGTPSSPRGRHPTQWRRSARRTRPPSPGSTPPTRLGRRRPSAGRGTTPTGQPRRRRRLSWSGPMARPSRTTSPGPRRRHP